MPFATKTALAQVLDFSQARSDSPQQLEPGDFNGDGRLDFLVTRNRGNGEPNTTYRFLLGQADGTWSDQTEKLFSGAVPGAEYVPRVAVADFNGDGRSDVYLADFGDHGPTGVGAVDQVWLSNAAGQLQAVAVGTVKRRAHGLSWADVDGDGDLDVMVNAVTSQYTAPAADLLLINDGKGRFTDQQSLLPAVYRSSTTAWRESHIWSLLDDLTGDGKPDLVLGGWEQYGANRVLSNPPSRLLVNDGTGNFANSPVYSLPKSPVVPDTVTDLDAVDLNGDGLKDLLVAVTRDGDASSSAYYGTGYLQILINQGGGRFSDETAARYPAQVANAAGPWWKFVRVVDFNRDGAPDLLLTGAGPNAWNSNLAALVLMNDGKGRFSEHLKIRNFGDDSAPTLVADSASVADVNGDGYPDIVGLQWLAASSLSFVAYTNLFAPVKLAGSGGNDVLTGGSNNDVFSNLGAGDDVVNGSDGCDTVNFPDDRAQYVLSRQGQSLVADGREGHDTLQAVERLVFRDRALAFDMEGNAGKAAKILGAVFGAEGLANPAYVGIGLSFLDRGVSYPDLMQMALTTRLGANPNHRAVVELLYNNVIGRAPDAATRDSFVALLDQKVFTVAGLAVIAADGADNKTRIDLVGLADRGLEYQPYVG